MEGFIRRPLKEERALLRDPTGDFNELKEYLSPLIQQAVDRARLDREVAYQLKEEILSDVAIAVRNFLSHDRDKEEAPFSVYFTWYIAQRINRAT